MNDFAVLATVSRNGIIESTHLGDLVVADAGGQVRHVAGNPERLAYYRSSSKPLQALTVVGSGAADRFSLTRAELAVCCASHCGSALHVKTVAGILEKIGLDASALQCGTHMPGDETERRRLIQSGEAPTPLHNNCSGKHAGMLAAAVAMGADTASYLDLDHPVQKDILTNLELATDISREAFHIGADGCGAPTVAVPLQAVAVSFARLANPDDMPADFRTAALKVCEAMGAAPEMVSGPGSFNTVLLDRGRGHLVAKAGAEGLFALGICDPRRLGVAMKTADGSSRPQPPVIMHLVDRFGALAAPEQESMAAFSEMEITNCHGTVVGRIAGAVSL